MESGTGYGSDSLFLVANTDLNSHPDSRFGVTGQKIRRHHGLALRHQNRMSLSLSDVTESDRPSRSDLLLSSNHVSSLGCRSFPQISLLTNQEEGGINNGFSLAQVTHPDQMTPYVPSDLRKNFKNTKIPVDPDTSDHRHSDMSQKDLPPREVLTSDIKRTEGNSIRESLNSPPASNGRGCDGTLKDGDGVRVKSNNTRGNNYSNNSSSKNTANNSSSNNISNNSNNTNNHNNSNNNNSNNDSNNNKSNSSNSNKNTNRNRGITDSNGGNNTINNNNINNDENDHSTPTDTNAKALSSRPSNDKNILNQRRLCLLQNLTPVSVSTRQVTNSRPGPSCWSKTRRPEIEYPYTIVTPVLDVQTGSLPSSIVRGASLGDCRHRASDENPATILSHQLPLKTKYRFQYKQHRKNYLSRMNDTCRRSDGGIEPSHPLAVSGPGSLLQSSTMGKIISFQSSGQMSLDSTSVPTDPIGHITSHPVDSVVSKIMQRHHKQFEQNRKQVLDRDQRLCGIASNRVDDVTSTKTADKINFHWRKSSIGLGKDTISVRNYRDTEGSSNTLSYDGVQLLKFGGNIYYSVGKNRTSCVVNTDPKGSKSDSSSDVERMVESRFMAESKSNDDTVDERGIIPKRRRGDGVRLTVGYETKVGNRIIKDRNEGEIVKTDFTKSKINDSSTTIKQPDLGNERIISGSNNNDDIIYSNRNQNQVVDTKQNRNSLNLDSKGVSGGLESGEMRRNQKLVRDRKEIPGGKIVLISIEEGLNSKTDVEKQETEKEKKTIKSEDENKTIKSEDETHRCDFPTYGNENTLRDSNQTGLANSIVDVVSSTNGVSKIYADKNVIGARNCHSVENDKENDNGDNKNDVQLKREKSFQRNLMTTISDSPPIGDGNNRTRNINCENANEKETVPKDDVMKDLKTGREISDGVKSNTSTPNHSGDVKTTGHNNYLLDSTTKADRKVSEWIVFRDYKTTGRGGYGDKYNVWTKTEPNSVNDKNSNLAPNSESIRNLAHDSENNLQGVQNVGVQIRLPEKGEYKNINLYRNDELKIFQHRRQFAPGTNSKISGKITNTGSLRNKNYNPNRFLPNREMYNETHQWRPSSRDTNGRVLQWNQEVIPGSRPLSKNTTRSITDQNLMSFLRNGRSVLRIGSAENTNSSPVGNCSFVQKYRPISRETPLTNQTTGTPRPFSQQTARAAGTNTTISKSTNTIISKSDAAQFIHAVNTLQVLESGQPSPGRLDSESKQEMLDYFWSYQGMSRQMLGVKSAEEGEQPSKINIEIENLGDARLSPSQIPNQGLNDDDRDGEENTQRNDEKGDQNDIQFEMEKRKVHLVVKLPDMCSMGE